MTHRENDTTNPGATVDPDVADVLAAIVRSSDDAIYSKDKKAVITSWNRAAEKLYGYTAQEALGQPVSILIPEHRTGEELGILHRILLGERIEHYETERVRKDGTQVDVSISVSPVHNAQGEIVQASVIGRDVSERKALARAIEEARAAHIMASRKQALELNDEVVQGLASAKFAFETGRHEQGLEAVSGTLERAKALVSRLLDEHTQDRPIEPGDLTRERGAEPS
jgi:PAS domain S-box-containing protein